MRRDSHDHDGEMRLVGRTLELESLERELSVARRGEGRIVFVVGEAGIGKSRLVVEFARAAKRRGAWLAWAQCHEYGAPPYWPIVQALNVLRAVTHFEEDDALAHVLRSLEMQANREEIDSGTAGDRFGLFAQVRVALGELASKCPVALALVLEDVHWADLDSLAFLEFLVPELHTLRILIVCTLRDDGLHARQHGRPIAKRLLQRGRVLSLQGLRTRPLARLIEDHLGSPPAPQLVQQIHQATGGHPFYALEIAHAISSAPHKPIRATDRVEELLRRRLSLLSPPARRALDHAAALGCEFQLSTLARVLDTRAAELCGVLSEAEAIGLIHLVPGSLHRYTFIHALMRDALYDSLRPEERGRIHAAITVVLEAVAGASDDRLPALAYHAFEAARLGDSAPAVRYARLAGARALGVLAFDEAVSHFQKGLAALERFADPRESLLMWMGLGSALRGTGQPVPAERALREAVRRGRDLDASVFGEAVLCFASLRREIGTLDVETNTLLEQAVDRLGSAEPSSLRARLMASLAAGLHLQPGADEHRVQLCNEAVDMARQLDDRRTLSFVLARSVFGLLGPDHLEQRIALTDEILRIALPGRANELEAWMTRADAMAESGDRSELDRALAVVQQGISRIPLPVFLWTAMGAKAALALVEGRFEEAEKLANEALSLGRRVQAQSAGLHYVQVLLQLRGWQNRLAEVAPLVESSADETRIVPAWRAALAALYCSMGRELEATREFAALAADDFASLPRDTTWLTGMILLADVCVHLGDRNRAELLYSKLHPYAGRIAVASPLVVLVGPVDLRLGMLAVTLDRYADAEMHYADALVLSDRMRALPWRAHTLYLVAQLRRATGAPGEARSLLEQAGSVASSLGMDLVAEWIRRDRVVSQELSRSELHSPTRGDTASWPGKEHAESPTGIPARCGVFRKEGAMWILRLEEKTVHLPHMRGLGHLARLIAYAPSELHVCDLVGDVFSARREPDTVATILGDTGPVIDSESRSAYQSRVRDIRDELEEAKAFNDSARAERLESELDFIARELSRATGLAGRPRRHGAAQERARLSVTRAIKYAIKKIAAHHCDLADHLDQSIRTGAFCSYSPPSRDIIHWTF